MHYSPWPGATSKNKGGRPRNGSTVSPTARGYGQNHQVLRKVWADRIGRLGAVPCSICHKPIRAGQRWHLAHADDPAGSPPGTAHRLGLYLNSPAYQSCNSAVNRRRHRAEPGPPRPRALDFFGVGPDAIPWEPSPSAIANFRAEKARRKQSPRTHPDQAS